MTLQECYAAMGADYDDVLGRLRSDRLVQKFVLKFLNDEHYELLITSFANEDYEEAFRAAHTIKGICLNLGFTELLHSSSNLAEALRCGYTPSADDLIKEVEKDYFSTINAIKSYKEESENV